MLAKRKRFASTSQLDFNDHINTRAIKLSQTEGKKRKKAPTKIENYDTFLESNKKLVREAKKNGKSFSSFLDEMFYSKNLVLLKLKNRNRYISLHSIEDEILNNVNFEQVYP